MKPKTVPIKRDTFDADGKLLESAMVPFQIMPPHKTACQVCGRDPAHDPEAPHDKDSLYYQYAFYGEHGRWPTWKDAMAHCDPETRRLWKQALGERGIVVE